MLVCPTVSELRIYGCCNPCFILEYKQTEDAYEVGTQFSKETHIRDEDDEMRKFIEIEMKKRKGVQNNPWGRGGRGCKTIRG